MLEASPPCSDIGGPRTGCFWRCNVRPTSPTFDIYCGCSQKHICYLSTFHSSSFLKIKMPTQTFQLTLANPSLHGEAALRVCACLSVPLRCKCLPPALTPRFSRSSTRQSLHKAAGLKCSRGQLMNFGGTAMGKMPVFCKEHKEALRNILAGIFADAVCFVAS